MPRTNANGLLAFIEVANERSFTKAAAKIGVSTSALSQTIRNLEEELGIRLLARTTRNVAPTEAGERLLVAIRPHFEQIEGELDALSELKDKPSGTIRLTCLDHLIEPMLQPIFQRFLPSYPDIKIEVSVDYGLTNIVEQRFDAGIRIGESISKDMIAVRIGPDWRFAVVGSPSYFASRTIPETPQELVHHNCINVRLTTAGGLYAWEFKSGNRELNVRVEGQLIFNSIVPVLQSSLRGLGLACVPEDLARPYIERGELREVLTDWCPVFQGFHLYYPNRRQPSPAFAAFVDALRYRG